MRCVCLPMLMVLAGLASAEDGLRVHRQAGELAKGAVVEDWPRFLGPRDDGSSREGPLLKKWPAEGLPLVWEREAGEGYAAPVIGEGSLVYFHQSKGVEMLECLDPESGKRHWQVKEPVVYKDRYGFAEGPRGSPVIDRGRVFVAGVTAVLRALDLKTGRALWQRDLQADFGVPQYFFGYGPSPAVWKDRVLVNVGGKEEDGTAGVCVAAFDRVNGETVWEYRDEWGASYASPVVARMHGREVVLVMAGGESKPAVGGLLVLDAKTGKRLARVPWRARKFESVLAASPLVLSGNRVFFSECYEKGGKLIEFDEDFRVKELWENREFGMHWMMPMAKDGFLYGFAGRNPPDTAFKCADLANGELKWEDDMQWKEGGMVRGLFRASILNAGGRYLCLGEDGALVELKLKPAGPEVVQRTRLFTARESWTLPTLHRGLLYVCQNTADMLSGEATRLLCYDLRGGE